MKKGKIVCQKGLREFKNGCPEAYGPYPACPCWRELTSTKQDGKQEIIKCCSEVLKERYLRDICILLDRNYAVSKDMHNGLCNTVDGKSVPKSDPMVEHLVCLLTQAHNGRIQQLTG